MPQPACVPFFVQFPECKYERTEKEGQGVARAQGRWEGERGGEVIVVEVETEDTQEQVWRQMLKQL